MLVLVSVNFIGSSTEHTVLFSTHPRIILWSEEFSSIYSKYVYNKVVFDGGELEDDVL